MRIRSGQMLIEVVVALAVAALAVLALAQVSKRSVSNSGTSSRQSLTTAYATEGVEWIRREQQGSDWDTFSARASGGGTVYCISNLTWTAGACGNSTISGTEFTRQVTMVLDTSAGIPRIEARVEVSRRDGDVAAVTRKTAEFLKY